MQQGPNSRKGLEDAHNPKKGSIGERTAKHRTTRRARGRGSLNKLVINMGEERKK